MEILEYVSLELRELEKKYRFIREELRRGNFRAAQVAKLSGHNFYRAKLDDKNRVLFRFGAYRGETVLLIYEIIRNHDYAGSRFLRGAVLREEDFRPADAPESTDLVPLKYVNRETLTFHELEKPLSFDDLQQELYLSPLPLILVGAAGSGKTAVTLEKIRSLPGRTLYVSHSKHLVRNAQQMFSRLPIDEGSQEAEFLSFQELLETISVPSGREVSYEAFRSWIHKLPGVKRGEERKFFEEFRGVLTGAAIHSPVLSQEEYAERGVRQSIFSASERGRVYSFFRSYLTFLQTEGLFDSSILATEYSSRVVASYDTLVIDEIQDFTIAQVTFLLRFLKNRSSFLLCGDAHQIIHPNYFSWASLKTFLFHEGEELDCIRILRANFRNASRVTEVANLILRIKQNRFGSVDRESTFLVESSVDIEGRVVVQERTQEQLTRLNENLRSSARCAVIVPTDELKEEARRILDTPLVFSVFEAKGLEYDQVILLNFVSTFSAEFREITHGMTPDALEGDFSYRRARDKEDKSLEIYKFYMNALYVGVTRALQSVYLVEDDFSHPLFGLLGLKIDREFKALGKSSVEEWMREAQRLEQHGKAEQAQLIRERFLKTEAPSWKPLDVAHLTTLYDKALREDRPKTVDRMRLLQASVSLGIPFYRRELATDGFAPARQSLSEIREAVRPHLGDYSITGWSNSRIMDWTRRYGVDCFDQSGQTALSIAVREGRSELVTELLSSGASAEIRGLSGLTPFLSLLSDIIATKKLSKQSVSSLAGCYFAVVPTVLRLRFDGRLILLSGWSGEFIVFCILYVLSLDKYTQVDTGEIGFTAAELADKVKHLPAFVLSPRRNRREYLSSMLSKSELQSNNPYSRRFLFRVRRGEYVLRPDIEVETPEGWKRIYESWRLLELLDVEGSELALQRKSTFERFSSAFTELMERTIKAMGVVGTENSSERTA